MKKAVRKIHRETAACLMSRVAGESGMESMHAYHEAMLSAYLKVAAIAHISNQISVEGPDNVEEWMIVEQLSKEAAAQLDHLQAGASWLKLAEKPEGAQ